MGIPKMDSNMEPKDTGNIAIAPSAGVKRSRNPTYKTMVQNAIKNMQDRNGSTKQSIVNHITGNYQLGRSSLTKINNTLASMTNENSLLKLNSAEGAMYKLKETDAVLPSARSRRRKRSRSRKRRSSKKRKSKRPSLSARERDVAAKERSAVVKERSAAAKERSAAAKERNVAAKERSVAAKERDVQADVVALNLICYRQVRRITKLT